MTKRKKKAPRAERTSCLRKIKHATEREAKDAMFSFIRSGKTHGFVRAYRCKYCNNWHWGHVYR